MLPQKGTYLKIRNHPKFLFRIIMVDPNFVVVSEAGAYRGTPSTNQVHMLAYPFNKNNITVFTDEEAVVELLKVKVINAV